MAASPSFPWFRKRDVFKTLIMALIFTLGLSLHELLSHIMNVAMEKWNKKSDALIEWSLRLLYPSIVIVSIWYCKAQLMGPRV